MKTQIIAVDNPVTMGEIRLTLVCRQSIRQYEVMGVQIFDASKEPLYAVVSYRGQTRAIDMTGSEVTIRQVKLECPALDALP